MSRCGSTTSRKDIEEWRPAPPPFCPDLKLVVFLSGPDRSVCKLHGCESVGARVWSFVVVTGSPVFDDLPGMAVTGDQVFVEAAPIDASASASPYGILTAITAGPSGHGSVPIPFLTWVCLRDQPLPKFLALSNMLHLFPLSFEERVRDTNSSKPPF